MMRSAFLLNQNTAVENLLNNVPRRMDQAASEFQRSHISTQFLRRLPFQISKASQHRQTSRSLQQSCSESSSIHGLHQESKTNALQAWFDVTKQSSMNP